MTICIKNGKTIRFHINKKIAVIGEHGDETIELNIVQWSSNPEKYDLRRWNGISPLKGITLDSQEAEALFWALSEELGYGSREDYENNSDYEENDFEDDDEDENDDADIDSSQEEIQKIDFRSFFVVKSMDECDKKAHDYREVVASVPMMIDDHFKYIEFPAVYCYDCNIYYISLNTYYKLQGIGKILCQTLTAEEYERYKAGTDFTNLSPRGPLALLGYNVAKNGLSKAERRQLLDWIIANGILKKSRVVSYLEFFIKQRQGQVNMSEAVSKWREDKQYLLGVDSAGINAPPMGVARFIDRRISIGYEEDELPFY